jgi:multidrug resistance protein, MATE family
MMASDVVLATVSLGISVAASHRIGNLLGANMGRLARKVAGVPYLLAFSVGSIECIILLLLRKVYGHIFTDDTDVIKATTRMIPILALFQPLDLMNGSASGVLRGAGKPHYSGVCNFLAYYGVGLFFAWLLCFRLEMGLFGLWSGIFSGGVALLILQTGCIWWIRWDDLGERISKRS